MVLFSLRLKLPAEKCNPVLHSLWKIIGPTEVQPGCLGYRAYSDTQNDDCILIQGSWETQQQMETHIGGDDFRTILAAMDLAEERPQLAFYTVNETMGIELIERIRLGKATSKQQIG